MLIVTRGRNDKVIFPTLAVEVAVLRIEGRRVQLGIKAPTGVRIYRAEVADKIKQERRYDFSI